MAISIAYGIAFATVLTLVMLPIFLSFSNKVKVNAKWLATGNKVPKELVERAIKEQKEELHQQNQLVTKLIKESPNSSVKGENKKQASIELEGKEK
jgi:predicted RND superfamily exporter protein